MESEDIFSEDITEEVIPAFDNEIEEVTEEVEATEETANENENAEPSKQKLEKSSDNKIIHLPLARIRNIMKLDPDLHIASNEAVFCVTRATELFIASIARESYHCTTQSKKKTIQRRDIDMAIDTVDTLEFLEGVLNSFTQTESNKT